MEIADAEELFDFPLHPYTRSLISAIPIPDPKLEKNKVLFTYDPSVHDYSEEAPELVNIGHDHYVFGNSKEIAEYTAIREKGVPLKSITIRDPNAPEDDAVQVAADAPVATGGSILERPIHDTGSKMYAIASFFLAPVGLLAGWMFKRRNYLRNYKACKKGAIAGLCTVGALIALFGAALLLAVI